MFLIDNLTIHYCSHSTATSPILISRRSRRWRRAYRAFLDYKKHIIILFISAGLPFSPNFDHATSTGNVLLITREQFQEDEIYVCGSKGIEIFSFVPTLHVQVPPILHSSVVDLVRFYHTN